MSLINITNLTFYYEGSIDSIFSNVSFQIDTDWKLGFVGRNGRGKTTFLNLLLKKYEYIGTISHSVAFDYFPFEITNKSKVTLEIINQVVPNFEMWVLQRELNLLAIDEDCLYRQFDTLSGGEQSKILLAALFLKDNNFLLIDEPTNHLDKIGRQTVSKYLSKKKSFIVVSHDRQFLDGCVDHILSINRANIEVQKGNFSSWLENKQKNDSFEIAKNEKLIEEISRLKQASKRTSNWAEKGHKESTDEKLMGYKEFHRKKAGKLDSQAKVLEMRKTKAAEEKSKLLKNIEATDALKIFALTDAPQLLLDAVDLSISYDNRTILSNFRLTSSQGDRIALIGKNGCGKSSLLKLFAGENISYSGSLHKASKLKISYVPQDTSHLKGNLRDFVNQHKVDETLLMSILTKLDFNKTQFEKDISEYSSGQKKKLLLAKSLCEKAHLYIWDEPLNYIDILSRIQIENTILDFKPTILFVEHDQTFADKISTHKIEIV